MIVWFGWNPCSLLYRICYHACDQSRDTVKLPTSFILHCVQFYGILVLNLFAIYKTKPFITNGTLKWLLCLAPDFQIHTFFLDILALWFMQKSFLLGSAKTVSDFFLSSFSLSRLDLGKTIFSPVVILFLLLNLNCFVFFLISAYVIFQILSF